MNTNKQLLTAVSFILLFLGCHKPGPQGWTDVQRDWFYNTSQGSQLIRYTWMLALEQPKNSEPFLSDEHVEGFRYLPRGFDPNQPDRANHLPVGWVKDGGKDQLGFTCAACHTTELAYGGQRIRIDGAGTLANAQTFIEALTASVKNTYAQDDKFKRFADRVLGEGHSVAAGVELQERLGKYKDFREDYAAFNHSTVRDGFSRLDAVGRIYKKVLTVVDAKDQINDPLDAPVSYPFLWGTDQSDFVQWEGFLPNANVGRLARNVGELLGVFGHVDLEMPRLPKHGYRSSVRASNQIGLEQLVRDLHAPAWPENVLPKIDQAKAGRGGLLYQQHCAQCHNIVERTDVNRKVVAWMERLDSIKTDPTAAQNLISRKGKTGVLEGRPSGFINGPVFRGEAPVFNILNNIVAGMLGDRLAASVLDEFISIIEGRGFEGPTKQGNYLRDDPINGKPYQSFLAYKGRSLTGAWATAPYLHNGSVPSLWQLLLPPDERITTFYVGTREFDPEEVGFKYKAVTPGSFALDTTIPGNWNSGHDYGTGLSEEDKWALIEFMKTDMGPT